MSKFQLVFMGIFATFILIGIFVFASGKSSKNSPPARALVWGAMKSEQFQNFLSISKIDKDDTLAITYVEKNPASFDQEFLEALASGKSPDLVLLPIESLLKHKSKIYAIPYKNYSARDFKDTFIEEGELFLAENGVLGIPFTIDPLVMYWNRDIFSNASIANPPQFWNEFYDLAQKLTKKDGSLNIRQSVAPFGEFSNVTNAKEIISALIMQAGSPITRRKGDLIEVVLQDKFGKLIAPAESAINFYTEFANPLKAFYSWNRSLPKSKEYFISGDLAVYFGFASEIFDIQAKNSNLNFDVTYFPQAKEASKLLTYGKMQAFAIPKNSTNKNGAFQAIAVLSGKNAVQSLSDAFGLPPVRRDLLKVVPESAYKTVFYNSAIRATSWLQPEGKDTTRIFQDMIESITAGRKTTSEAVQKAGEELRLLIK